MSSTVCHIEYKTEDLEGSQRFCEKAFGWDFRSFGDSMIVFGTPEGHIGGFVKGAKPTVGPEPEVCYRVDSLDPFIELAQSLGAKVVNARREVPGVGFYASIQAPDGNGFGVVEFTDQS
jgi:predicted enzyme related to lactoylglutathione lyase